MRYSLHKNAPAQQQKSQSEWPKTTVPLWLSDFDDWLCLSFAAILFSVSVLQRSKTPYHKPYCRQLLFLFISFFRRVFQFLVAFFILQNCRLHQRKGEHDRNNAGHTGNSQAMGRKHHDHCGKHTTD